MPGELWVLIPGLAQAYEVSNLGRVRNALGREMKPKAPGKFPYPTIMLRQATGKRITKAVHRLVGDAFLGSRPDGQETRHLNGDVMDNRAGDNLVWGTHAENCEDTARHGRLPMGENHCCAVLTEAQVFEARRLARAGTRVAEISRKLNAHRKTIGDAVARRTWKHLAEEGENCSQS